jgi:hypothetical protein
VNNLQLDATLREDVGALGAGVESATTSLQLLRQIEDTVDGCEWLSHFLKAWARKCERAIERIGAIEKPAIELDPKGEAVRAFERAVGALGAMNADFTNAIRSAKADRDLKSPHLDDIVAGYNACTESAIDLQQCLIEVKAVVMKHDARVPARNRASNLMVPSGYWEKMMDVIRTAPRLRPDDKSLDPPPIS